jgi:hypothetical protein
MKKISSIISIILAALVVLGTMAPVLAQESNDAVGADAVITANATDIQSRLRQMRSNLKDFRDKKTQEAADAAAALNEKIASKRKAIEARVAEAKKIKEEKRKTVLLNLIDIQIKQFTNTKERVAKMPNITADSKTQLNTKIDAAIAELNAEKAKVQAAVTPEELKNLAKEIKDLFKAKHDIVKQIVDAILASRANNAITKAEGRLAEIKTKIAELKASGADVSGTESLLANAEAKISAAESSAGKEDLKKAISELKDAYKALRQAVAKLNGTTVATPVPTPTATPVSTFTPTPTATPATTP